MMREYADFTYDNLADAINKAISRKVGRTPKPVKKESNKPLSKDAQTIFELLKAEKKPQGKSWILLNAGIDAADWTDTINELKNHNLVTQTGAKRGTKYHA